MSSSAPIGPTGHQYEISSDGYHAAITEVGATLRMLRSGSDDLIIGFGPNDRVTGGRGQQLLPWPNRVRDGRYRHDGTDHQLALTEPERHNAIHGLARWQPWELVHHSVDRVTQQIVIHPQEGWDTVLLVAVTHHIGADGLTVTVTADNAGDRRMPFGYAAHPYLTAGEQTVDDLRVTVPADSYLRVDDRLLPVGLESVDGRQEDLRSGNRLGATGLDTAFTDLTRDSSDVWRVRLAHGDRETSMWADTGHRWIQVFTAAGRGPGLAVEPMTCGPDAFNSPVTAPGLITLAPGERYQRHWGIWAQ